MFKISTLIVVAFTLVIAGCSGSGKKEKQDAPVPDTIAKPIDTKASAATAESKKETEQKPETATIEEIKSDVEVIVDNADDTELKLKPIPETIPSEDKDIVKSDSPSTEPEAKIPAKDSTTEGSAKLSEDVGKPESRDAKTKPTKKPDGKNHVVITVHEKDESHPFFGKGHKKGFLVNGVAGDDVVAERGATTLFEVETDPLHDVYLTEKEIGWGSSTWIQGVEGQFIYNGIITFKPTKKTPNILFYGCRNHPYMGGKIHVINKGEKVTLTERPKAKIGSTKVKKVKVTKSMVSQKLMFANMLLSSKATDRIEKSDNSKAKTLQADAKKMIVSAKEKSASSNYTEAFELAEKSINNLKKAKKLVPSNEQLTTLKDRYSETLVALKGFEKSHKKNFDRESKEKNGAGAVDYDKQKVARLKEKAAKYVKDNDYVNANKSLDQAQRMITVALKKMLHGKELVYDLNFESAEEEYEYELRRFKGYVILIPIAIKAKKPNEGTQKLMISFQKKGEKMRDAAMVKAKSGDFPTAIAMMHDATKQVRRSLKMVGIN